MSHKCPSLSPPNGDMIYEQPFVYAKIKRTDNWTKFIESHRPMHPTIWNCHKLIFKSKRIASFDRQPSQGDTLYVILKFIYKVLKNPSNYSMTQNSKNTILSQIYVLISYAINNIVSNHSIACNNV